MTSPPFTAIDHVQLAITPGGEDEARKFYVDILGMREIPKPTDMAKRGGCWFESGSVQIHVGIEPDFKASKKAHPALRCSNYQQTIQRLQDFGIEVKEADGMPGVLRAHILDPFGNRIELIDG